MTKKSSKADICLFLEGTYPYVSGGVSTWTHDLIQAQNHLTFHLVCILAPHASMQLRFEIPANVVGIEHVFLQKLPQQTTFSTSEQKKAFFQSLEVPLLNLQHQANLAGFKKIIDLFNEFKPHLGAHFLLDSEEAWNMLQRMYLSTMGETSFLHYFWSWRSLLGAFYSILLADLPSADVYHTLCTGYAGLFLARAHLETLHPCLITEHGIYTNERRIEITAADWLKDIKSMNLNIERTRFERDLKDYWIDSFIGYSKLCYEACTKIITIYEGNKELQMADGADSKKIHVIPNGVNYERYSKIEREISPSPIVALIGRVVPIKDIKSFIRAIALLKQSIPTIQAWILGPTDEDEDYYQECLELVQNHQLESAITFMGKVNIEKYIGKIDVLVLTSISEAQPLSLLEAGAAGIPCVATNVGACREIIFGRSDEIPKLGTAGCIAQLSNPESIANQIFHLLSDCFFYQKCSQTIKKRVEIYYNEPKWRLTYKDLYKSMIELSSPKE